MKKRLIIMSMLFGVFTYSNVLGYTSKIKKIVNPEQYTTLLGLFPKSATSTFVLTKMLY